MRIIPLRDVALEDPCQGVHIQVHCSIRNTCARAIIFPTHEAQVAPLEQLAIVLQCSTVLSVSWEHPCYHWALYTKPESGPGFYLVYCALHPQHLLPKEFALQACMHKAFSTHPHNG